MNRTLCLMSLLTATALSTSLAHAEDLKVNPRYQVWSHFKPGSLSTLEADFQQSGDSYHITTVRTLISVTDDKVTIETKSSFTVKGKTQSEPPRREMIPAMTRELDIKELGEKAVDAMGKTFNCKVLEARGTAAGTSGTNNSAANVAGMKGILFSSAEVPGGIVRLEASGKDGKGVVFILTGMEVR